MIMIMNIIIISYTNFEWLYVRNGSKFCIQISSCNPPNILVSLAPESIFFLITMQRTYY